MNLSFDYYHNLKEVEFYLCNPDGRQLFPLVGFDRKLKLRFNDLSELTFGCYATTTKSDGSVVPVEAYDYVQTRRLVFVTGIGWFVITNATEVDNGVVKYKNVTCHSLQAALKDRGFYCEERVYYFYNPSDPTDSRYDPNDDASVPSVMGQLYQQLGIQQALTQGLSDPATPYSDWTITYINSSLIGKARNFKESTDYGYEWMVRDVEAAFEVVILFDFYNKTIHVMRPSEITTKANVIYSFSNFMKEVEIEEDAENIVTVMNCNGDNCDITGVNPTGTNYICDFSYYMDADGKWMSSALKTKINAWKTAVANAKTNYETKVQQLRTAYDNLNSVNSSLQEISRIYTDLSAAVAKKSIALSEGKESNGIPIWCETVDVGQHSIDEDSVYNESALSDESVITAYKDRPDYNPTTKRWEVDGEHYTGTIGECFQHNNSVFLYFIDNNTGLSGKSYCVLQGMSRINTETYETEYVCRGFKRYADLDITNEWEKKYSGIKATLLAQKEEYEETASEIKAELGEITSSLNIINYFSETPSLLKELYCYWIEGDYTNENISVDEETTQAEAIDLENELLEGGALELSKVCQPKLQFSLTSADCTKQYEFRNQMNALELGKIITVEKEEGVWYYPTLLEIEYDLDRSDTFGLRFANALRLDDWGYTYGDLMSDAASTSRKVSANWQNILAYSKDKEEITPLIKEPLSSTLRAAFANMSNQEFTIDETGILGRKFVDAATKDEFEDEQVRIINNVILFTDDNWETVRTAFGKISYTDDNRNLVTTYGIVGDAIIGSLVMGEKLKIKNANSTIELNDNGITIKKTDGTVVFSAKPDGSLVVSNYASQTSVDNLTGRIEDAEASLEVQAGQIALKASQTSVDNLTGRIEDAESEISQNASAISAKVSQTYGSSSSSFGWSLTASGFYVYSSASTVMKVTSSGLEVSGKITATSGVIGTQSYAFTIGASGTNANIYCGTSSLAGDGGIGTTSNNVYIGTDGLSYKVDSTSSSDYTTVIRSGIVMTYGDANGSGNYNRAVYMVSDGIFFANAGANKVGNVSIIQYEVAGIKLGNGADHALLKGTWKSESAISTTSDRTQKHNIENLDDRYSLFIDRLIPRRFQYNDGKSGRYHTGFIAQEVKESMDEVGLNTQELAAYVSATTEGQNVLSLRYEEFIALNTWQIQILKQRVSELEQTIKQLQNKE